MTTCNETSTSSSSTDADQPSSPSSTSTTNASPSTVPSTGPSTNFSTRTVSSPSTSPKTTTPTASGSTEDTGTTDNPTETEWQCQDVVTSCEFTWVIKDYTRKRESGCKKAEYSSTSSDVYGNKWRLIIYVNGNGKSSNNHLSLFLQVADCDTLPFGWRKNVSYVLTLEHPEDKDKSFAKRNPDKTFKLCPKAIDWGWSQFITSDRIQQDSFISSDTLTVRAVVTVKSSSVQISPDDSELYLKHAVEDGSYKNVKYCLTQGASVNCQFKDDLYTPLHTACSSLKPGSVDVLNLLLSRNADGNAVNKWLETPLLIAANNGHEEGVKALLKNGADPSKCSEAGWSALTFAAHKGYERIVSILLTSSAPVNCRVSEDASTPLHKACAGSKRGHLESAKMLLEHGADVHALNKWKETPLLTAANNGQTAAVKSLLEYNADACLCTDTGWSPLSIAAYKGHDEVVKLLLREGAPTEEEDPTLSALLQAATKGLPDTVMILLKSGANHNVTTKKGDTALSILVEQNLIDAAVKMVTKYKASIPRCSRDRKKVQRARLLINLRIKQQQRDGILDSDLESEVESDEEDGINYNGGGEVGEGSVEVEDRDLVMEDDKASAGGGGGKKKKKKRKNNNANAAEAAEAAAQALLLELEDEETKAKETEEKNSKKAAKKKKKNNKKKEKEANEKRLQEEMEKKEEERKKKEREEEVRRRQEEKMREEEERKRKETEEKEKIMREKIKGREERERKEKEDRERREKAMAKEEAKRNQPPHPPNPNKSAPPAPPPKSVNSQTQQRGWETKPAPSASNQPPKSGTDYNPSSSSSKPSSKSPLSNEPNPADSNVLLNNQQQPQHHNNPSFNPPQSNNRPALVGVPELPAVPVFRAKKVMDLISEATKIGIAAPVARECLHRWVIRASHTTTPHHDPLIPSWTDSKILVSFLQRQLITANMQYQSNINPESLKEAGRNLAKASMAVANEIKDFANRCVSSVPHDWTDQSLGYITAPSSKDGVPHTVITYSGGQERLEVPDSILHSLRSRYKGSNARFLTSVFAVITRYNTFGSIVEANGGDLRFPPAALQYLGTWGIIANAYSDPLSADAMIFCGLFPDVDVVFGGLDPFGKEGGGGEIKLTKGGGAVCCIPPLEHTLAANYMRKVLERIYDAKNKHALSFFIILPSQCFRKTQGTGLLSRDDLKTLDTRLVDKNGGGGKSGLVRKVFSLPPNQHAFRLPGVNGNISAPTTSSLFVLIQNDAGMKEHKFGDEDVSQLFSKMTPVEAAKSMAPAMVEPSMIGPAMVEPAMVEPSIMVEPAVVETKTQLAPEVPSSSFAFGQQPQVAAAQVTAPTPFAYNNSAPATSAPAAQDPMLNFGIGFNPSIGSATSNSSDGGLGVGWGSGPSKLGRTFALVEDDEADSPGAPWEVESTLGNLGLGSGLGSLGTNDPIMNIFKSDGSNDNIDIESIATMGAATANQQPQQSQPQQDGQWSGSRLFNK